MTVNVQHMVAYELNQAERDRKAAWRQARSAWWEAMDTHGMNSDEAEDCYALYEAAWDAYVAANQKADAYKRLRRQLSDPHGIVTREPHTATFRCDSSRSRSRAQFHDDIRVLGGRIVDSDGMVAHCSFLAEALPDGMFGTASHKAR